MVLIRKQSAVVIKNMQDMHCQRCFVGPMWVVGAILLLTTIVFTATNAEHIQSNGAHAIRNASQVSAIFHLFQNYLSVCFFFTFLILFVCPIKFTFDISILLIICRSFDFFMYSLHKNQTNDYYMYIRTIPYCTSFIRNNILLIFS